MRKVHSQGQVAGCAGESPTNLTAATQVRALLAMRYEGVLPGAATTAPAQHISSVAAVERSVSEIGAALERRGAEPSALRMVPKRLSPQWHIVKDFYSKNISR